MTRRMRSRFAGEIGSSTDSTVTVLMRSHLGSRAMTLTPGERYTITYRERGEERTSLVHYRGFGTADTIARGDPAQSPSEEAGELHWFQLDGVPGYLTIKKEDLLDYEVADPYG